MTNDAVQRFLEVSLALTGERDRVSLLIHILNAAIDIATAMPER